jgi:hypothetical protein
VSSLLVGACASPAAAPTSAPPSPTPGAAIFQVIKPDGVAVDFTLDDLKQLSLTTIMFEGSPEEGPALLDVLSAAGITDFAEVTLTGSDGRYTYARADVTPEVVLDFNNRGGVKLASPTLPRNERVRDIFKIEVK